jgi:hypothetical protein
MVKNFEKKRLLGAKKDSHCQQPGQQPRRKRFRALLMSFIHKSFDLEETGTSF